MKPRFVISATIAIVMATSASAQDSTRKEITIATEGAFPPWNFTKADGKLNGFEIDLEKYLCAHMNMECKLVVQPFDGLIPALNAGKFDAIMSGLTVTPKRMEAISFSIPYSATGQTFAILNTSPLKDRLAPGRALSLVNDKADLEVEVEKLKSVFKGKVIGVQTATTSAAFLDQYFKGTAEIREYSSPAEHDLDLQAGRIDAIFVSAAYLKNNVAASNHDDLILVGPRFQGGLLGVGSGVGVRKEDNELREKFDAGLKSAMQDGTLERLSMKWFGFDVTPR